MSEFKDDQYYRDLGKGNPPPPELVEKLKNYGDGATIDACVATAFVVAQILGKRPEEVGETVASMLLELGFRRA